MLEQIGGCLCDQSRELQGLSILVL